MNKSAGGGESGTKYCCGDGYIIVEGVVPGEIIVLLACIVVQRSLVWVMATPSGSARVSLFGEEGIRDQRLETPLSALQRVRGQSALMPSAEKSCRGRS